MDTKNTSARMSTLRDAAEYNMNHRNRGEAIIFNHEKFQDFDNREGTNKDCEDLSVTLKHLDFNVTVYQDFTQNNIFAKVKSVASQDHKDNDCIAIAILSHGINGFIAASDTIYLLEDLLENFTATNSPSLAGKPKLFFIQACRGEQKESSVMLTDTEGGSSNGYKIPNHADFLIAYATIPRFVAWRNCAIGSWFIQSLVKELQDNGRTYDILTLLTFVNQKVALEFELRGCKQASSFTSMLTRIFRFTDKNPTMTKSARTT